MPGGMGGPPLAAPSPGAPGVAEDADDAVDEAVSDELQPNPARAANAVLPKRNARARWNCMDGLLERKRSALRFGKRRSLTPHYIERQAPVKGLVENESYGTNLIIHRRDEA